MHLVRDGRGHTRGAAGGGQRDERAASLAAALPAIAAGRMLGKSDFGWPLVIGGTIKAVYDLLLLHQFRDLRPPEEAGR